MPSSQLPRVIEFLQANVIGRTVTSEPIVTRTNQGRTESAYVDQNFFSKLVRTPDGFTFDLTSLARGERFGLDSFGNPVESAGTLDAIRVYRYDVTERASTGRLLGFARFLSSTNANFDPLTGTCFLTRMMMEGDDLLITDTQIGYGDFVARGGQRVPVAVDGAYRYTLRGSRLAVHYQQHTYDVDPQTLARTPTGDTFPVQVSVEAMAEEPIMV
jgi:hypothetical protein